MDSLCGVIDGPQPFYNSGNSVNYYKIYFPMFT